MIQSFDPTLPFIVLTRRPASDIRPAARDVPV
jgi:hypothetical protein